jgi:hypothetical protein
MPIPDFYTVGESPFGSSYEEHVKKFWKTYLEIPLASNPMFVPDLCSGVQSASDPVYYLPANLGVKSTTKDCSTKEGKSILIPIIGVVVLPHEVKPGKQGKVAHKDEDSVKSMYLQISIGDSSIALNKPELGDFRIRPGSFRALMPKDGLYDAPAGDTVCIADGYYVITRPILAGSYEIKFGGKIKCTPPNCVPGQENFTTDNTINLKVRP